MTMRVLFFGDVVARSGRGALKEAFARLVPEYKPDFVVANVENAAHGNGILPEMAQELLDSGIDVLTLGNHAWDQRQIVPFLSTTTRIVRPINYPDIQAFRTPGRGSTVVESKVRPGLRLGVIQGLGRVFMDSVEDPFRAIEAEADRLSGLGVNCILVDFHAEASSEKIAISWYLDGKVSAVIGTHWHVQTSDERILPGGTAAITDVGMCGCFDSVIGVKKEISIQKFLTKRPVRYEPAEGAGGYSALFMELDEETGRALNVIRLHERVAKTV
jgi:metallophosphoesterase (TIGR00282 family)